MELSKENQNIVNKQARELAETKMKELLRDHKDDCDVNFDDSSPGNSPRIVSKESGKSPVNEDF